MQVKVACTFQGNAAGEGEGFELTFLIPYQQSFDVLRQWCEEMFLISFDVSQNPRSIHPSESGCTRKVWYERDPISNPHPCNNDIHLICLSCHDKARASEQRQFRSLSTYSQRPANPLGYRKVICISTNEYVACCTRVGESYGSTKGPASS